MSTITVLFLQSVKLYTFVRIVYLVTLFCQTITLLHKQAKKVNRIEINDNRELKTCNKKSDNILVDKHKNNSILRIKKCTKCFYFKDSIWNGICNASVKGLSCSFHWEVN